MSETSEKWSRTTLGSSCEIKARIGWRGLTASEYTEDGPLLIAGKHIQAGEVDWSACDHISNERYDQSPEIMLRQGDVVFSKDGSIGNPALIRALPGPATINGTMMMLRPDPAQIDPEFLLQFVGAPAFARMISEKISGSSIPHIFQRDIIHFPAVLPPLEEQRQIAEVLRSIDDAIRLAELAEKQTLRCLDATLGSLMAGGDNHEWIEGRCDNFFVLQRGFDITEAQAVPGPYQVISSSGPTYQHSEAAVGAPAVVTGRKGRLGAVYYSEQPCWPHDTTLWVKDFKGNEPRFVFWKMKAMKLETLDAATSVPTLNRNNVHALVIQFPSVRRQAEIAEILDAQERALLDQQAQVCALQDVKAKFASDLLSGRVRVPA